MADFESPCFYFDFEIFEDITKDSEPGYRDRNIEYKQHT